MLHLQSIQVINVYDHNYESGALFWPDVHHRLIISILIFQLLIGLLSTKQVKQSTIALLPPPVLTFWFHRYCKGRFESAFVRFLLQEAMIKDTLERAMEPAKPKFESLPYLRAPTWKGRSQFSGTRTTL
ncbi:hypothetical protein COLO4_09140 [Corchorus olitorius]|uniref:CSC1/OSCA1-like 7TM region domain-containing protein n=1 Tax=Corchorus olitorius TaxID=93759 RepID=A0A1R3KD42_9ROSI|nr:hypothetical protein COLO4_09140 [Corchorus olitorius]